jgi:hypothetical protein
MGRLLLIGVIVIGILFVTLIMSMNKQAVKLPQVFTNDLSSKETQNLSNYAMRYALQFASSQHFPGTVGFTRKQTFTNFFYKYGYIDSIRYSYMPAPANNYRVKAYIRTTLNGQNASHVAVAAIGGINSDGGTGNVFHFSFEGNLIDTSPNHNNGIDHGNLRFKTNGMNNSCVWPDGNNDWIQITDNNSLDLPSTFSVVGWVNWNSDPNHYIPILWKPLPTTNPNFPHPSYGIWIWDDHLYACVTTTSNTYIEAISTNPIAPQGTWHFAAITYGGGYLKLYYDGVLVGQHTAPMEPPINSPLDLQILTMPTSDGIKYFKGRIDEFGVYDYTLTLEQILAIWNSDDGILPVTNPSPYIVYLKE